MRKSLLFFFFAFFFAVNINSQTTIDGGLDCKGVLDIVDVYWSGPDQEYIVEFDLPEPDLFGSQLRILHLTGCGSPLVLSVDGSGHCTVLIQMAEQLVKFGSSSIKHFTWDWELVVNQKNPLGVYYHYHITVNAVSLI